MGSKECAGRSGPTAAAATKAPRKRSLRQEKKRAGGPVRQREDGASPWPARRSERAPITKKKTLQEAGARRRTRGGEEEREEGGGGQGAAPSQSAPRYAMNSPPRNSPAASAPRMRRRCATKFLGEKTPPIRCEFARRGRGAWPLSPRAGSKVALRGRLAKADGQRTDLRGTGKAPQGEQRRHQLVGRGEATAS